MESRQRAALVGYLPILLRNFNTKKKSVILLFVSEGTLPHTDIRHYAWLRFTVYDTNTTNPNLNPNQIKHCLGQVLFV